jgi:signal transduction histidine kinase
MVQQIMRKGFIRSQDLSREGLARIQRFLRWIFRNSGFLWRGLLAWLIGLLIFFSDDLTTLDTRLKLRGNQDPTDNIALITLGVEDLASHKAPSQHLSGSEFTEVSEVSDRAFWNEALWEKLLLTVLNQNPKAVVVTFFFSENIRFQDLTNEQKRIFSDSRIIWASADAREKPWSFASGEIHRDQDGIIRRFPEQGEFQSLAEKVTHIPIGNSDLLINYRGDQRAYLDFSLNEALKSAPIHPFEGRFVFIGPKATSSSKYLTPLGPSSRHLIHASMADHLLNHRTITRIQSGWYLGLITLAVLFTLWIMNRIPPTIALVLLAWTATVWTALSIYIFDTFYFWLPISSVLSMMLSSYVFLLGYQANQSERKNFQLQQEQKYLHELEQLKNNFVSLISHDLKTPIAKIQAILDRITLRDLTSDKELSEDLSSLRQSNDELNRYIQSILQVLRVESRAFRLDIGVHDLNEVILEVHKQLVPLAKGKDIKIEFALEPIFSIEFDRTLIREVIVNILDNAIKYSPRLSQILISSTEVDGMVKVTIKDNGTGITEQELPTIWAKFTRGKDQELRTKGSGLGLYLVKFFIELHGGQVFAQSQFGKGTTLGFSLPVEQNLKQDIEKG